MKRIQLTMAALLVAAGLVSAGGVYGQASNGVSRVIVRKADNKKVRLYTPAQVEVAIIDANGTTLYKGDVKGPGSRVTAISMINLPDGHYYLTATNNDFWVSQGLTIRNDQLSVDAQNATSLVKPTLIPYGKNKFELAMPGTSTVSVALYDRLNALVFSETYVKGDVHRFDLNRLPEGDYTFVVGPDFKQFTEQIAVQR
jgi:archaellum component FlaF (FlaF/FlaG flagellin family)